MTPDDANKTGYQASAKGGNDPCRTAPNPLKGIKALLRE